MKALMLGALTTSWSTGVVPALNLSPRSRAVVNAAFGVSLAAGARAPLGLGRWRSGLRWGLGAAAVPVVGAVVVSALGVTVPPSDEDLAEWIFFRIPVGTVLAEELVFRAAFDSVSPRWSPVFFGLWHIHPARAAGDSVVGTVATTTAAGVLFSWLRHRSGSILAPTLLHYAINASGAVLAVRGANLR